MSINYKMIDSISQVKSLIDLIINNLDKASAQLAESKINVGYMPYILDQLKSHMNTDTIVTYMLRNQIDELDYPTLYYALQYYQGHRNTMITCGESGQAYHDDVPDDIKALIIKHDIPLEYSDDYKLDLLVQANENWANIPLNIFVRAIAHNMPLCDYSHLAKYFLRGIWVDSSRIELLRSHFQNVITECTKITFKM